MCTLHTAHCTLHTPHCTLHTTHCTLLHTAALCLHTAHCTLHTVLCTLYSVLCTLNSLSPRCTTHRKYLNPAHDQEAVALLEAEGLAPKFHLLDLGREETVVALRDYMEEK